MKSIAVTQRVVIAHHYRERRDCLDQAWTHFLLKCKLMPVPVSNEASAARELCERASIEGLILTGGNDLAVYGGDAPERDATENMLLDYAAERGLPVLGICRGMQVIQHRFGIPLKRVMGHVTPSQLIRIESAYAEVNSYHEFGATETRPPLEVWAMADDGVIKAIRHVSARVLGLMWHPERCNPFTTSDIALFSQFFGVG